MSMNQWYLNENEDYSSYTDFTTNKTYRQAKPVMAARKPGKKKRAAGKALLCVLGAITIAAVSISGTWFYLTEMDGEDLINDGVRLQVDSDSILGDVFPAKDTEDYREVKEISAKSNRKGSARGFGSGTGPAYDIAEELLSSLQCDDDLNTAYEIFNWVHTNIAYQTVLEEMSFEDAAYRGFTRKSGDCYVYFACAKMLLDCAGIPNMMVERYPVITNGHYWNLVQFDGEWYHCDATVFKDHPGMYFMCTDEEIADEHHEFDGSLYPERASSYWDYSDSYGVQPGEAYYYDGGYYDDYYYDDYYYDDYYYNEDYSDAYVGYNDLEYIEEWG